ncbi:MAG: hypothetical protein P4L81_03575 [Candidatus Pacebacteria bacterium]|nr:hypothetical protein [Candidatus Paceibacterota bacterium]
MACQIATVSLHQVYSSDGTVVHDLCGKCMEPYDKVYRAGVELYRARAAADKASEEHTAAMNANSLRAVQEKLSKHAGRKVA